MRMKTLVSVIVIFANLNIALGQTSGPSTPSVQRFIPASTKEMVNLFTGDLNYNISLFEMDGGYPVNLSYSSALGMTEEAAPVGFGWQINIGRINRIVKGLPDDFKGDRVIKYMHQQREWSVGVGIGIDVELFGGPLHAGATAGLTYSNVRGVDLETDLNAGVSKKTATSELSAGLSLGMSTKEGASISANAGVTYNGISFALNSKINSMEGIKYFAFSAGSDRASIGHLDFPLIGARTPFTPRIDFPATTVSGTFKYRFGPEVWGVSTGGSVYGQASYQFYPEERKSKEGYGYLYLQDFHNGDAIMDLAAEKESPVFEEDQNLSFSYLASDVYAVSAQGISGNFRPFRKNTGLAHNENISNSSVGGSMGLGVHSGAYFQGDIDITANVVDSYSGEWQIGNGLNSICSFNANPSGRAVYFKSMGETNRFANKETFDNLGGTAPANFSIGESTVQAVLNNKTISEAQMLKKEEPQNTAFVYLTAAEAEQAGKPILSYHNFGDKTSIETIARKDPGGYRKDHHISYISITKDDGTIYEFGVAAYNTYQKEVSFNVNADQAAELFAKKTGYVKGKDNTMGNENGRNNYYIATETPGYVYAYLLTAVYSPDYADLTGDGPTPDDMGTYTRFNYTREEANYKWRTPYDSAYYQPNNLCDKLDDMGSYVYGEKEIWTIHSMETKNFVAEFYSSARQDAVEVKDENGGINAAVDANKMSRIDSIKVFSHLDYRNKDRVAVKSIFFGYSYGLCLHQPASQNQAGNSGKLTLKRLSFSYDNSLKEKLSDYRFSYNNEKDESFPYNESLLDIWGSLKQPDKDAQFSSNMRFPFAGQIKSQADQLAQAWLLKSVSLPAGGSVNIDYEAKDYAYVQDKKAMRMYKIVGFTNTADTHLPLAGENIYDRSDMIVDAGTVLSSDRIADYCKPGDRIYASCILSIYNSKNVDDSFNNLEEANGYFPVAKVERWGIDHPTWLRITLSNSGKNPVARCLWQKMRKNLTHVLYPPVIKAKDNIFNNIFAVVTDIPKTFFGFTSFLQSYETQMMNKGRGELLNTRIGSYVRLGIPSGRKLGGGSRVRRITVNDNWEKMTQNVSEAAIYGQDYNYNKIVIDNGRTDTISSGVAAYEPVGNSENPFLVPAGEFNGANVLAPELYYYKTEPFGESFFPAPGVGYSEIKVTPLHDDSVIKNATGFEVTEFYTTKDFPTIARRTEKFGVPAENFQAKKYTASQGFSVELNDMNGKLKAQKAYSQLNAVVPVSGTEYIYKTSGSGLDNTVSTISSVNGNITKNSQVGIDYDFNISTSESRSFSSTPTMMPNIDVIPAVLGIPFPVPTFWSTFTSHLLQYKGVTTSKIIYRAGLIDSVKHFTNGNETSVKNILYDDWSGEPVVTALQNEYNEPYYITKLPAHWLYKGMGPASVNAGVSFSGFNADQASREPNLRAGDELLLIANSGTKRGWVYPFGKDKKTIIDESGEIIHGAFTQARILRSGNRNRQSLNAGQVITKTDPTAGDRLEFSKVIDASACSFRQNWQVYFGIHPLVKKDSCNCFDRLPNLTGLELEVNSDGTIRHPSNAAIDGSVIRVRKDSCTKIIQLDRGITNLLFCEAGARLIFDSIESIAEPGFCNSSYRARGHYSVTPRCQGDSVQRGIFVYEDSCLATRICKNISYHVVNPFACAMGEGTTVNPYLMGLLGNWKQETILHFNTDRMYDKALPLKDQGIYKNFTLYTGADDSTFRFGTEVKKDNWQHTSRTTVIDPLGNILENLNGLNIPSSRLFGYGYNLPVATAENAHYFEMAFDGFEDYDYLARQQSALLNCNLPSHFKFSGINDQSRIIDSTSHTGVRSLLIAPGSPVSLERVIETSCMTTRSFVPNPPEKYPLSKCNVVKTFTPVPGQKYVLSLWIGEQRDIDQMDTSSGSIRVSFLNAAGGSTGESVFHANGVLIDNWQQLSQTFTVPPSAAKIKVALVAGDRDMLIDDIRIQPFNSSMKSFVYDLSKRRLMATLDEQNFALYYEYDGEGQLTRTKKETVRGIVTVEEIRSAKPKRQTVE